MAYTLFDPTGPNSTQTGSAFAATAKANNMALRDAVIWGLWPGSGYSYAQSGGTVAEPNSITAACGVERIVTNLSWGSGNIVSAVCVYYPSIGGTPETATTASFTYDGNGDLTAITGAAIGPMCKLLPLLGKYKALASSYASHIASTAAHSMGTCALQNSNNVGFTGGTVSGVTVGADTGSVSPINATYLREAYAAIAAITTAGQTATADLALGGWLEISVTANATGGGNTACIKTSNDLTTAMPRVLTSYFLVYIPSGGDQLLVWKDSAGTLYSSIAGSLPSNNTYINNKSHIFVLTQRSNGSSQVVKMINYLGILV